MPMKEIHEGIEIARGILLSHPSGAWMGHRRVVRISEFAWQGPIDYLAPRSEFAQEGISLCD